MTPTITSNAAIRRHDIAVTHRSERHHREIQRLEKSEASVFVLDAEMMIGRKAGDDAVDRREGDHQDGVEGKESERRRGQPRDARQELFQKETDVDEKRRHVVADDEHDQTDRAHCAEERKLRLDAAPFDTDENIDGKADKPHRNQPQEGVEKAHHPAFDVRFGDIQADLVPPPAPADEEQDWHRKCDPHVRTGHEIFSIG